MKTRILQIVLWVVLVSGMLVFIFPFFFMISNSFEKFTFVLPSPPHIFPKEITLDNYRNILLDNHYLRFFFNSVIVAVSTTFFSLTVSSLSAYGFSRIKFSGREFIFGIYLFTLMIPGVLNIIPQYGVINTLHSIGTRHGLILLYLGTSICGNTFFLRGFFQQLPRELEESVKMDGGGHFTIYRIIAIPLSAPALATLSILVFQGIWDDFFTAKVILGSNPLLQTLPVMIQRLHGQYATQWGLIFAASLLMLLPIFFIYVFFQKYFVIGGFTEGSVKG